MAVAVFQTLVDTFVNGTYVPSGGQFTTTDTYIPPTKPVNNHSDPSKVVMKVLAIRLS